MFSEKEQYILNWIKEVSKIRPELNGFAICPFAEKSKFKIVVLIRLILMAFRPIMVNII